MKVISTLGILLRSLVGVANVEDAEHDQKNVEICIQNLTAIGKAVRAYHDEHGDFPEWLSELYPKYLSDASLLLCPADEGDGKPIFSSNTDPKMPVSYGYQFHPEYREQKAKQREVFGDAMPLARCRHHENQDFDCLNLSFSFQVYPSSHGWESTPEDMYGSTEAAIAALDAGLQRQPGDESFFSVYPTLAHFYIKVGQAEEVERLINRFKSNMKVDDLDAYYYLSVMLEMMRRDEEVLEIFEELEGRYPDNPNVCRKLARIHEKLGNSELSIEYWKKAESKPELIGKPVSNFSATDLDGNSISLQDYRGKIVLLDFWGVWCGFCTLEMPNLKKVYDTYKDEGFDVIGVTLGTDEAELRNYIKENDIQWRQICSGEASGNDPLAQQYEITGVPEPWLIARDGTLISTDARGALLEHLVSEALKDKSKDQ